jgi:hypothetical protein
VTPEPGAAQKAEAAALEGVKSPKIVVNRAKSSLGGDSSKNQHPTSREIPSAEPQNGVVPGARAGEFGEIQGMNGTEGSDGTDE